MWDDVTEFNDKKGRTIELRMINQDIEAFYQGQRIGGFVFNEIEEEYGFYQMVINMHLEDLPGFKHCGIGGAIVRWAEEYWGWPVVFGKDDGMQSDDGSHLTGDGPWFAEAIYRKHSLSNKSN